MAVVRKVAVGSLSLERASAIDEAFILLRLCVWCLRSLWLLRLWWAELLRKSPPVCAVMSQLVFIDQTGSMTYVAIERGSLRSRSRTPWSEKARDRYEDSSMP